MHKSLFYAVYFDLKRGKNTSDQNEMKVSGELCNKAMIRLSSVEDDLGFWSQLSFVKMWSFTVLFGPGS